LAFGANFISSWIRPWIHETNRMRIRIRKTVCDLPLHRGGVWRPKYSKNTWADLKRIEIIKRFLSYVSICTVKCRDENKVFFFNGTCKKIGVFFFPFIIMSIGFRPLKTKLVDLCLGSWTKQ
jgi:hypothetical protein